MNLLVVGGGGREHSIIWKLKQSPEVKKIWCAPGNGGIAGLAECVPINVMEFDRLINFARSNSVDLTIIGPEDPLCGGIVDAFQDAGLRVFGPVKAGAMMEGSKVFSKQIMVKCGVPTAHYQEFDESSAAVQYVRLVGVPIVVKAYGNALGKGVAVCHEIKDAESFIYRCLDEKEFGEAGSRIIVEEYLEGEEVSVLALTDGKTVLPMSPAQDHKPAYDNDEGPNTGGMGAYSPAPLVTPEISRDIHERILVPAVKGLAEEGITYKGVLYAGLMMTRTGPKVLEFNARFGDPEAQAILPRLENDLLEVIQAVVDGNLDRIEFRWSPKSAVCVVMASGGYPGHYDKNKKITGIEEAEKLPGTVVFHAGTKLLDGNLVTSGGRVLGVTALGDTIYDAINRAYQAVGKIHFEGVHYRKDIGAKALSRERNDSGTGKKVNSGGGK